MVKLLRHAILVLDEGCNTSQTSDNFTKAHFDTLCSCLTMPRDLASSVIDCADIMCLVCVRLTLCMCTPRQSTPRGGSAGMFNFVAYSPENMPTLKNKPPPLFEKKALLLIALVKIHDHSHISTSLPTSFCVVM